MHILSLLSVLGVWRTASGESYDSAMEMIDEVEALFRLDSITDDDFFEFASLSLRTIILWNNTTGLDETTLRSAYASKIYRQANKEQKALLSEAMAAEAMKRGQMWFSADQQY